jgi:hypothetical protein
VRTLKKRTRQQKIGDAGEASAYMEPINLARARRYPANHPGADGYWKDENGILNEYEVKSTTKHHPVDPSLSKTQQARKTEIDVNGGKHIKIVKHIPTANLGMVENLRDINDTIFAKKRSKKSQS